MRFHFAFLLHFCFSSLFLYSQVPTRSWVPVASSELNLPSALPNESIGKMVEANLAGRGALFSWMTENTTTVIVGMQDGTLRKIFFRSGESTPTVSQPEIGNFQPQHKPRVIISPRAGILIMASSAQQEGQWTYDYANDVKNMYDGSIYISINNGDSWSRLGGASTGSTKHAGYLDILRKEVPGSIGDYAVRFGGLGLDTMEIMQFQSLETAQLYSGSILTIPNNPVSSFFAYKTVENFYFAGTGETILDSNGNPITQIYNVRSSTETKNKTVIRYDMGHWGFNLYCRCDHHNATTIYPSANVYGYSSLFFDNGITFSDREDAGNLASINNTWDYYNNKGRLPYDGFGFWVSDPIGDGLHARMDERQFLMNRTSAINNRREKAITTRDNTGFIMRYSSWSQSTNITHSGAYAYRGAVVGNTPPPVMRADDGTHQVDASDAPYFPFPQEAWAERSGFLALVSAPTAVDQPSIWVSEQQPTFLGGLTLFRRLFAVSGG